MTIDKLTIFMDEPDEDSLVFNNDTWCVIYKEVHRVDGAALTQVIAKCAYEHIGCVVDHMVDENEITQEDLDGGLICYTTQQSFIANSAKLH